MTYESQEPDYTSDIVRDSGAGELPVFGYERLKVYKKAKALRRRFSATAVVFPTHEKFNLTSQLQRASLSVVLNIVEGSTRLSGRDQARFTEVAYGSLLESFECVVDAEEASYVSEGTSDGFRIDVDELARMLNAYRNYQLSRS